MSKKKTQKKKAVVKAAVDASTETTVSDTTAGETAAPIDADAPQAEDRAIDAGEAEPPKKSGKRAKGELTLSELAQRYLRHLEDQGKSQGTCFSYQFEMQSAISELGPETKIGDITVTMVEGFFESARVTRTRSGRKKSPLSIAKTQRVLRQALAFAAAKGWIEVLPLYATPETSAR